MVITPQGGKCVASALHKNWSFLQLVSICVAAVSEVNGILGKNLVKFCSGDFNLESVPQDTKHLDPLLASASKSPPAQVSAKGLNGMASLQAHSFPQ